MLLARSPSITKVHTKSKTSSV